jgi:hypothetical protein
MKGITLARKGLIGVAVGAFLLAGSLLVVGQVSAASGTLTVTDATAAPGDQATVDLVSDVTAPGLGAWTVDISYDSDVVSVVSCEPEQGGVCNPNYVEGETVRITGASASGIQGEEILGSITFECGDTGSSDIELSLEVFADATIGAPEDIDEELHDGHIECAQAQPTTVPAATATSPALPPTGLGGGTSSNDYSWLIAGLSVLGVAALAGYSVLRARR